MFSAVDNELQKGKGLAGQGSQDRLCAFECKE